MTAKSLPALEPSVPALWTVHLVRVVRALDGAVAPPLQGDASGRSGDAGELCRLAGGREAASLSV